MSIWNFLKVTKLQTSSGIFSHLLSRAPFLAPCKVLWGWTALRTLRELGPSRRWNGVDCVSVILFFFLPWTLRVYEIWPSLSGKTSVSRGGCKNDASFHTASVRSILGPSACPRWPPLTPGEGQIQPISPTPTSPTLPSQAGLRYWLPSTSQLEFLGPAV